MCATCWQAPHLLSAHVDVFFFSRWTAPARESKSRTWIRIWFACYAAGTSSMLQPWRNVFTRVSAQSLLPVSLLPSFSLSLSLVLTLLRPWLRHCLSVFYMTLLLSTVVWRDTMYVYFIKISILSHVVHKICLYSIKYEMCYKYRLYSMKIWTVIYVTVFGPYFF